MIGFETIPNMEISTSNSGFPNGTSVMTYINGKRNRQIIFDAKIHDKIVIEIKSLILPCNYDRIDKNNKRGLFWGEFTGLL